MMIAFTLLPQPLPLVAILDSGCDLVCLDSVNFTNCPDADVLGHGTEMAIIIRRSGCRILDVKIADDQGIVWPSALAKGIVWAADNGATHINISATLPGDESGIVTEAVQYALARGVVIVAAQRRQIPSYPAVYPGVIAVQADGELSSSECTAYRTFTLTQRRVPK